MRLSTLPMSRMNGCSFPDELVRQVQPFSHMQTQVITGLLLSCRIVDRPGFIHFRNASSFYIFEAPRPPVKVSDFSPAILRPIPSILYQSRLRQQDRERERERTREWWVDFIWRGPGTTRGRENVGNEWRMKRVYTKAVLCIWFGQDWMGLSHACPQLGIVTVIAKIISIV